jgi:ABC-type uncharacterized transport system permease subunit
VREDAIGRLMVEAPDRDAGVSESAAGTGWVGGRAGCMAAFLFALPTGSVVFFIGAMGECMEGPSCGDSKIRFLATNMAIVLAVAALSGLSVRVLVRRARLRGTDAAPRGWAVALAIPFVVVLGLFAIWLELAIAGML